MVCGCAWRVTRVLAGLEVDERVGSEADEHVEQWRCPRMLVVEEERGRMGKSDSRLVGPSGDASSSGVA